VKQEAYQQIPDRMQMVREHLGSCRLCPRECKVNRLRGQTGFCGLNQDVYCFREMINPTEELCLAPSHQLYFAGCNLRCGFCSVAEWNHEPTLIAAIPTGDLPKRIEMRKKQGADNINLLGGEPAVNLYGMLKLLQDIPVETRVVWNSNMYFSQPVREALDGLVDVFLADYKCDKDECCRQMLGVDDYTQVIRGNLVWASKQSSLLIRHVALPGHFKCCGRPILQWIADNVPNAEISLRNDYIPPLPAGRCPAEYLGAEEYQELLDVAKQLSLKVVS